MSKRPSTSSSGGRSATPATEIDAQGYSAFVSDLKRKIAEARHRAPSARSAEAPRSSIAWPVTSSELFPNDRPRLSFSVVIGMVNPRGPKFPLREFRDYGSAQRNTGAVR